MIFLLNQERVLLEVLNATRVQAARKLEIPEEWVSIRLERNKPLFGKVAYFPVIEAAVPTVEEETSERVRTAVEAGALAQLMQLARTEIDIRLKGLDT